MLRNTHLAYLVSQIKIASHPKTLCFSAVVDSECKNKKACDANIGRKGKNH